MNKNETEMTRQYLTFVLGGEDYAFPVTAVREVLTVPKVTRIPRMPDFMCGFINLRGSVVPILDLKLKFAMGATEVGVSTAIIVVEIPVGKDGEREFLHVGVYADMVKKVITLGPEDIEGAPRIGTKIRADFISGMGRVGDGFTVILDVTRILTDEDMELVEAVHDGASE